MRFLMSAATAASIAFGGGLAWADCVPLGSDSVSLGEKAARYYADNRLNAAIESERQRLETVGKVSGRVSKTMNCAPYPNLIGADEWRCVGAAKVCSK